MRFPVEIIAAVVPVLLGAIIGIQVHMLRRLERVEIKLALVAQRLKLATGEAIDTDFYKKL